MSKSRMNPLAKPHARREYASPQKHANIGWSASDQNSTIWTFDEFHTLIVLSFPIVENWLKSLRSMIWVIFLTCERTTVSYLSKGKKENKFSCLVQKPDGNDNNIYN